MFDKLKPDMCTGTGLKRATPIQKLILLNFVVKSLFFLLLLLVISDNSIFYVADTYGYLGPAKELLSGSFTYQGVPTIVRTPGYPLFLLPGILLGQIELVTIFLQIIVNCITLYIVYRMGLLLFKNETAAIICGMLFALEPLSTLYTYILLSEALFTMLLMLFLYLFLLYLQTPRWQEAALAALCLAASIYVRPIAYYLPLLIALLMLLWVIKSFKKQPRGIYHLLLFILIAFTAIGTWQVRNYVQSGYSGFAPTSDINIYYFYAGSVIAHNENIPFYELLEQMGYHDGSVYLENHPDQENWSPSMRYRYMNEKGTEIIKNNLPLFMILYLKGAFRTVADPGATKYLKLFKLYPYSEGLLGQFFDRGLVKTVLGLARDKPLVFWSNLLLSLFLIAIYLLAFIGLLTDKGLKNLSYYPVILTGLYLMALLGGPMGYCRFRYPVMPLICLFAGKGLYFCINRKRRMNGNI